MGQPASVGLGGTLFAMAQTLAVVCALPATPFQVEAGYVFAGCLGSLMSLASLYAATMASFLIGQFLARSWAEMIEKRPFLIFNVLCNIT